MKSKTRFCIMSIILGISTLFMSTNCKKDEQVKRTTSAIVTNEVQEVSRTTATINGDVTYDGGATVTERGVCWSTNPTPTIADSKTIDGSGEGSFTSKITGLIPVTAYYARAYATNKSGTSYGSVVSFKTRGIVFNSNIPYGTISDIDDNIYKTVTIGTQTWMAENLKVTRYNDGASIPNTTDILEWSESTTGAYCSYKNSTNSDTIAIYGLLYNWYAVNTGKLAPEGWHVPSNDDWIVLVDYLMANGYNYDGTTSGNKLAKAFGSAEGWVGTSVDGTIGNNKYSEKQNKSGFTALPSRYRDSGGEFGFESYDYVYWWTSTKYFSTLAYGWNVYGYRTSVLNSYFGMGSGFSVRCVKD
jgi:uncharacterized protein (TIGR02145 family)